MKRKNAKGDIIKITFAIYPILGKYNFNARQYTAKKIK
jgi:hypothetical protein